MNANLKYHNADFDVRRLNENNIDRIQFAMLPENSTVLEIGCATGFMSAYLQNQMGCTVTGVELNPAQAAVAREHCRYLIEGNIATASVQAQLDTHVAEKGKFAVVFMSQVIEHIAAPQDLLTRIRDWIMPGGCLVVSTCNVAHWRIRLNVMLERWEYTDYGILDRTHLRFFTVHSFRRLLQECGFNIVDEGYSFEDICPFRLLIDKRVLAPTDLLRLIPFVGLGLREKYIYRFKNLIATQFAFKAIPVDTV